MGLLLAIVIVLQAKGYFPIVQQTSKTKVLGMTHVLSLPRIGPPVKSTDCHCGKKLFSVIVW
jgi:hypothetical protein